MLVALLKKNISIVLGSTKKQVSISSSAGSVPICATCDDVTADDVTAVIPDVVIYSADAVTDESRAASTTVSGDVDQSSAVVSAVVTSATAGVEPAWRGLRSLSTGDLNVMPANSRSLPHLPFIAAAAEVPGGGRLSTDFGVDPVSRRSLSSLQSAGVRTWCDGGALRPGGSLAFVAGETPLTSSASSAATTAGGAATTASSAATTAGGAATTAGNAATTAGGEATTASSVTTTASSKATTAGGATTTAGDTATTAGGAATTAGSEATTASSAATTTGSEATTAGGAGGSDVSGCVADSLDDDEPAPSTSQPPPPTLATTQTLTDDWNRPSLRRLASGTDNYPRSSTSKVYRRLPIRLEPVRLASRVVWNGQPVSWWFIQSGRL